VHGTGWDNGANEAGGDVVDVAGHCDRLRENGGRAYEIYVAELQFEESRRVGPGVQARDHVNPVSCHDACRTVGTGGSEMPVPLQQRFEIGHASLFQMGTMCCRYTTMGSGAMQEDVGTAA
jgi:hypothetical protein